MRCLKVFPCAFALLFAPSATAQRQKDWFFLTVKLIAAYEPRPAVCILVRTGEVFETVVMTGKTKTEFSGKLQDPKNQVFPMELDISQGDNSHSIKDRLIYELHVGIVAENPTTGEMSNHSGTYDREVRLCPGGCQEP